MFTFLFSMLNAADQAGSTTQSTTMNAMGTIGQILPFILIGIVFYIFIIRPQSKQKQQLAQMIQNIKLENKVITKGGMIGEIEQILETSFIVKLHDGTKVEILKQAIISIINGEK